MKQDVRRSIRAETLKLLSLPATYLTALGTFAVSVLLAVAFGHAARQGGTSALDAGLATVAYSQAGFLVLGVITATSEYQGGQIRTTLTALPRRVVQHLAKLVSLALFALPVAAATTFAGIATAAILVGDMPSGLLRMIGASAGLTLSAVLAGAVATVVRRSIPALAVLLGYYFIVGPLLRDRAGFAKYLPDAGTGVLIAWVVLAVAISAATFRARDA